MRMQSPAYSTEQTYLLERRIRIANSYFLRHIVVLVGLPFCPSLAAEAKFYKSHFTNCTLKNSLKSTAYSSIFVLSPLTRSRWLNVHGNGYKHNSHEHNLHLSHMHYWGCILCIPPLGILMKL